VARFPHVVLLSPPYALAVTICVAVGLTFARDPSESNKTLVEIGVLVWLALTFLGSSVIFWGLVAAYDYRKLAATGLSLKQLFSIGIAVLYLLFVAWVWVFLIPMFA
jgi:hypothetical protein